MIDFSIYNRFKIFKNKTILAIDFGQKVIGTAFFKPNIDPFPYMGEKIVFESLEKTLQSLKDLILINDVEILVLGVPYYLDGKESENTKKTKAFGHLLKSNFLTVEFFEQDETLTTEAAKDRMKNSPQFNFKVDINFIDCLSATIILEDFIREK